MERIAGIIIIILSMVLVPLSAVCLGQGAQAEGGRDGSGSVILIHNVNELQNMSLDLNGSYALVCNIDASATKEWNDGQGFVPIKGININYSNSDDNFSCIFNGTFNGCGFSIMGLYINNTDPTCLSNTGLFFRLGRAARISNLTLIDANINGCLDTGTLAGDSLGTIQNCHVTGSVYAFEAGGLIGSNGGTILNCSSAGSVNGIDTCGGLVYGNSGIISDCYSTASVNGSWWVGGFAGTSGDSGLFSRCYSKGCINGDVVLGGFIGGLGSPGNGGIFDCYSTSPVTGNDFVGGFIGYSNGTISRSFCSGRVRSNGLHGGFLGCNNLGNSKNQFSNITKCYFDKQTTKCSTTFAGTGESIANMMKKATFKDWDFDNVWDIDEGKSYPFLRQPSSPAIPIGNPPSWISIPSDQVMAPGSNWSFQANATDSDSGDVLTYGLTSLPLCGLSLDSATGLLTWAGASYGYYYVTLTASDGRNTIYCVFNITVSNPPTPTSRAPEIFNVSGPSNWTTVATARINFSVVASDPDGDNLTYAWMENGNTLGKESSLTSDFDPGAHTLILLIGDGIHMTATKFDFNVALNPTPKRHPISQTSISVRNGSVAALAAIASISLVVLVAASVTEAGRYRMFGLLLPLYTRLHRDEVLDNETRGLIRGCIISEPGIHLGEIRRRLNLSNGMTVHHLQTLEREGIIRSRNDGVFRRFYPGDMRLSDVPLTLNKMQKVIFEVLRQKEGLSQREVAAILEASYNTVHRHINRMAELGVLRLQRNGMTVKCYIADGLKDAPGK